MEHFIFPPFVSKGDRVTIVSPSSKIEKRFLDGGKEGLESWGLDVVVGKHAAGEYASFSGTQAERLADLQAAMDDDKTRVIFCSRGGYGAQHLVGKLNFTRFRKSPKWLVGFSDITALHYCILHEGFASLHAPMEKHLTLEPEDDECSLAIHDILFGTAFKDGKTLTYTCAPHPLNHTGKADGILKGGNFAVAYGLRGTPYDIVPDGTILFVEDVGEKPHAIERMLYNLKIGGVLSRLSGLIIGQFTGYEDHRNLGKDLLGALADVVQEYDYPVCFGFPVGHVKRNLPLIEGARVSLHITDEDVKISFHI